MRVLFLGRKPAASEALEYLLERNVDVAAVVARPRRQTVHWSPRLVDTAEKCGLPVRSVEHLYEILDGRRSDASIDLTDIDLVLSFLYWKRIERPLIELGSIGCVNFHPAPLPEFRGLGGYNFAIYEEHTEWGVSAHFVEETFDTGPLIEVRKFPINPAEETAFTLEQRSQKELLEVFRGVIDRAMEDGSLSGEPQDRGRYISRSEFEEIRAIRPNDSAEEIHRKIRAFWYPPYPGAAIELDGEEFTLVDREILHRVGRRYHESGSSSGTSSP